MLGNNAHSVICGAKIAPGGRRGTQLHDDKWGVRPIASKGFRYSSPGGNRTRFVRGRRRFWRLYLDPRRFSSCCQVLGRSNPEQRTHLPVILRYRNNSVAFPQCRHARTARGWSLDADELLKRAAREVRGRLRANILKFKCFPKAGLNFARPSLVWKHEAAGAAREITNTS